MSQENNQDDLAALIRKAEGEASHHARQSRPPSTPSGNGKSKAILTGGAVVVAAYLVYAVWAMLAPPSGEQVARDLEAAVDAARDSVERARAERGQVPEAIPNAALGAVVRYESGARDYKLSATVLGIRVTLERDGRKVIERGVTE